MQRPAFWLQSDPLANPQFRRGWELPPPKRKRPGAAPTAHPAQFQITSTSANDDNRFDADRKARSRAAAEALFTRGRAA